MYLKQLTLRGFKSFASATTLVFEPGITCVVGPNGSGKSNVVDALAWVMGEQGAKSLRGGKMEDVIFAGTSKRAPLGRAEAELTIDNTDGALPIEYSEVRITRTMFRSGGSEYQINGAQARLLDVQELLSDSGIGREMHVIVGQGQLDAILQATPESRRGFIEEAAGVLKHRKRKEKALRKLEATKANLERLTDLVGELQRQLKPLGRQAQAARKAAVIQAELRDAKARILADDLATAQAALAAELADEQAMVEAREKAEQAVHDAVAGEEAAERALKQTAEQYQCAQETWYGLAALRERVQSTLSIAAERSRRGENQPQFDISGRDPEKLEAEAQEIREKEQALRADVEIASQALTAATLHRGGAEQRHAEAEVAYSAALRAVAGRREELARLKGKVGSVESRLQAMSEEVVRLTRRRDEAVARAGEAGVRYCAAEQALAGLGAKESDLDATYERAALACDRARGALEALRAKETELQRDRAAASARVDALRLMTARKDGSEVILNSDEVLGRLSDFLAVEPGWEAAIAAALGSAAESVVVEGLPQARRWLECLAKEDGGRVPMLIGGAHSPSEAEHRGRAASEVVQANPKVAGAVAWLLRDVVLVEDGAAAEQAVCDQPEITAVTCAGDVYRAWLVEGGSMSAPSLIEVSAQRMEAESELGKLVQDLDRLRFDLERHQVMLGEAERDQAAALDALHSSDAALAAVADELNGLRQTQAAAVKEAESLAEAIEQTKVMRAKDEQALEGLRQRLAVAADEGQQREPDSTERDELAVAARLARQQETEARLRLRTAEEQVKAVAGRAEGLLRAAQHERQSQAKVKARLEEIQREAQVAAAVHAAGVRLARFVESACQVATQERDFADQARRSAEAATTSARHASKAAAAHFDELVRGAHLDELTRIEHRMRIEQLTDKAITELGLDPETLITEYGPELPVPVITGPDGTALQDSDEIPAPIPYVRAEQKKRLRAAERNLQLLGRVNPLALEEFDAMTARHQFLAEQLEDLKRTRADLIDIVKQVDAKVQEVFECAYLDVERAFEEVFTRLFPGGQGKLVLTDPGDWLNTGVDVEARPAGKQVKRLSLLSGGERSLVAVAFLFALFIARPSPFYILDEVEAALDDANLGRLLGIYEELREASQLLVITHQKRTMEIADCLYGVAMRGDGISAVVSQRLHD